jgi:serine/threonine protein kinase
LLQSAIVRARSAPPLDDVLPVRHCLSILLCAARGMHFAHSIGFVLRDLQAETLMMSDDPSTATALVQARLVDVSRARRWLGSAVKNKNAASAAPSTPTSVATSAAPQSEPLSPAQLDALRVSPPECVAWRKPFVEPLSDVWSLGCLMIELFSWRKAFAELDTEARILNALRTGQRPDIGSVLPRYRGRRLLALIECCLRPLPEPLVMLADPDSGRITVGRALSDLEKLLTESQQ